MGGLLPAGPRRTCPPSVPRSSSSSPPAECRAACQGFKPGLLDQASSRQSAGPMVSKSHSLSSSQPLSTLRHEYGRRPEPKFLAVHRFWHCK